MRSFLLTLFLLFFATEICFAQWVQTNLPSNASILCLTANESFLYAGTRGQDIYRSTDDGDNWNLIGLDLMCPTVKAITFSGANVIAGTGGEPCRDGGGIEISTDNGMSWSNVFPDFRTHSFASHGNNVFDATGGVLFSSDNGMTWDLVNTGLPVNCIVKALTISGSKTFAGSESDGVFVTTNNGISWVAVNNGLSNLSISNLAVSGNHLFAGTYDGIYHSTDDGVNWNLANTGLPTELEFTNFAVLDSYIFISITYFQSNVYKSSVYLSTNYGDTWEDVSSGLPIVQEWISSITIKDNFLFAADDFGIWRRPLSEMITYVDVNINRVPEKFNLSTNYPNPFNPSTKMKYSVPHLSKVSIKVFDLLGSEIETLINEEKPAGTYELNWNAANLPSGVYFYQLRAGDFVQTKKMILLK